MRILAESDWRELRASHEMRVDGWTGSHLDRRRRGQKHPVVDFLYDYYNVRPAVLRRWHPGAGVALAGTSADAYLAWSDYARSDLGVAIAPTTAERLADAATSMLRFLQGIYVRPSRHDCFALHEWAMVYDPDQRRHDWPLRVNQDTLRATIDEVGLRCSHIDAYRFFAAEAAPLNAFRPTRATQADLDQPGCLHVNMDLYKWSSRFVLLIGSDLVADCFEHAMRLRDLDMQAAPYDLSDLGLVPIKLETTEGRAEFAIRQREMATIASELRARLITLLRASVPTGT